MKICIAFLGNYKHDSRITNLSSSLRSEGHHVDIISFDWFGIESDIIRNDAVIFKLHRGENRLLFYFDFAIKLLSKLFSTHADIYFAEDIYTLPFVYWAARLRNSKVYYNSRELYPFIGGLTKRPILQWIIRQIEKFFIKKVDLVLTTGELDSEFLHNYYGISNTLVIRNIPLYKKPDRKIEIKKLYNIPKENMIILYQGMLLDGRGLGYFIKELSKLDRVTLLILGEGEKKAYFKRLAEEYSVENKIIWGGFIEQTDLINYTAAADAGLCLIENISISYYHALPNKLFEYIMAALPVICSNLPQMKKIVTQYRVGEIVYIEKGESVADIIYKWLDNPPLLHDYRKNCLRAAEELNWQREYEQVRGKLFGEEK
ncbi:glycosyltransferase [Melioribacter sp. OK-6-Me]|uniref:glycosyltransferase n=1 Tax=unclassified Melioribacter TaxID=2627329 RepID=UPI003ED9E640